nr:hypothetical protein GCM10020093_024930 [Planobispora longispora]
MTFLPHADPHARAGLVMNRTFGSAKGRPARSSCLDHEAFRQDRTAVRCFFAAATPEPSGRCAQGTASLPPR